MMCPLEGLWVLPEHMVRNLSGDKGWTGYGQMPTYFRFERRPLGTQESLMFERSVPAKNLPHSNVTAPFRLPTFCQSSINGGHKRSQKFQRQCQYARLLR